MKMVLSICYNAQKSIMSELPVFTTQPRCLPRFQDNDSLLLCSLECLTRCFLETRGLHEAVSRVDDLRGSPAGK